jgi:drug/metabolite transporter (DMT)-like permease
MEKMPDHWIVINKPESRRSVDMNRRSLTGAALCFVAAASWGAMFPVAHAAFVHLDPFYFTMIRYGTVTLLLMAALLWKEGRRAFRFEGNGGRLWFYGTMAFAVYNLLIFLGQDWKGEPGIMAASVGEALMPMISVAIGWLFFRKKTHPFTVGCVLAALAGAFLVITKGHFAAFFAAAEQVVPSLFILLAVTGWVLYTMGAGRFPGWSALRYSTLSCMLGTATAGAVTAVMTLAGAAAVPSAGDVAAAAPHMLFMIAFPGFIALLGWNAGVKRLSPLSGLLFINFVPVTTIAVSLFQGHAVTGFDVAGTGLIILALLSQYIFASRTGREAAAGKAAVGETACGETAAGKAGGVTIVGKTAAGETAGRTPGQAASVQTAVQAKVTAAVRAITH